MAMVLKQKEVSSMDHPIHVLQQHHTMPMPAVKKPDSPPAKSFKDMLAVEQNLKVSKHAKERMSERRIHLNKKQWLSIAEKMNEAKSKGVNESLVLTNEAVLLVSAKTNTVVTAMNRDEASSRIFTNINGAIVINDAQAGP